MKLQLTPRFPVSVVGTAPIVVTKANGIVTISFGAAEPVVFTVDGAVVAGTGAVAITKNNPVTTNLQLPNVALQGSIPLHIIDWSTNVVNHQINLTPFGAQTIMRALTWQFFSNAAQLGSLTLYPSISLNGWFLAP